MNMVDIPSVYVKIAIQNGHFSAFFSLKMVIFRSYVELPEGREHVKSHQTPADFHANQLIRNHLGQ